MSARAKLNAPAATTDDLPDGLLRQHAFTEWQRRVLMFICEGLRNSEIAARVGVKEATIKSAVSGILRTLGVKSRTQIVVRACQAGMASSDSSRTAASARDLSRGQRSPKEQDGAARRLQTLTEREHEVLDMVSEGLLNKQIAFQLGVCEGTVKAHMGEILRKLNVRSRTEVVIEISRLQSSGARRRERMQVDHRKPA